MERPDIDYGAMADQEYFESQVRNDCEDEEHYNLIGAIDHIKELEQRINKVEELLRTLHSIMANLHENMQNLKQYVDAKTEDA